MKFRFFLDSKDGSYQCVDANACDSFLFANPHMLEAIVSAANR